MQTGKITALYVRFSFDDGIDTESGSIEHQKALLKNYAESNGFTNLSYYADDGYTGTNFNRPNFQRMMDDIKNGLVGTVIVKDMSRLGRNYLMVGQYVEIDFPKYDVRFIAINITLRKVILPLSPQRNLNWYKQKWRNANNWDVNSAEMIFSLQKSSVVTVVASLEQRSGTPTVNIVVLFGNTIRNFLKIVRLLICTGMKSKCDF